MSVCRRYAPSITHFPRSAGARGGRCEGSRHLRHVNQLVQRSNTMALPDRRRQSHDHDDLLWINKDANSKSLSNNVSSGQRQIYSHVQRWSRGTKRHALAKNTRTGGVIGQSNTSQEKSTDSGPPLQPTKVGLKEIYGSVTESTRLSNKSGVQEDFLLSNSIIRPICFKGNAVDPFDTAATKIDFQAHKILQYYINVLYPATWLAELRGAQSEDKHNQAVTLVKNCISNELHMFSILAATASRMENYEHNKIQGGCAFLIQRAMIALQRYLKSNSYVDSQVIYDVFNLFCAEAYRWNIDAALVHLQAVQTLVKLLGGSHKLDRGIMETIIIGDMFLAAELLAPPILILDWDPGKASEQAFSLEGVKCSISVADQGQALLYSSQAPIVARRLRTVIEDMIECVQLTDYAWTDRESQPSISRWLFVRNLAIRHRLLSMKFKNVATEALRIALIMWIMIVMTSFGARRSAKVMVTRLKENLLKTEGIDWNEHYGLLVWVFLIGAIAAEGTSAENWFLAHFAKICQYRRISGETQLCELCKSFFYVDTIQRPSLRNLVKRLSSAELR